MSQANLSALNEVSMGYFTSTQLVAAVAGFTSDKPVGTTDRHFGYEAAYPFGMPATQKPCDKMRPPSFSPVALR